MLSYSFSMNASLLFFSAEEASSIALYYNRIGIAQGEPEFCILNYESSACIAANPHPVKCQNIHIYKIIYRGFAGASKISRI